MVTLLFRFAKLGKFRGELQISNSFDASQMIINPTIPEAEAFKDMDNGDNTTMITFESNQESQEDNNKQGSVDLTDSQDLNDSVSTPSSKRKEDETNSVPGISSTSKKPCLMTVKVEKTEEAAKTRG
ncbi:hypothetical protein Bca4012_058777 [Brassica carinata]